MAKMDAFNPSGIDEEDDVTVDDTEEPDTVTVEHDMEGEEAEPAPFVYDEDSMNLAEDFDAHPEGKVALKRLGDEIVDNFDSDWQSCERWRQRNADNWKLFCGDLPEKTFPYADAANVHVPIMMENLTRVHFRLFGELFPDWSDVFGVASLGPQDDEQAQLLSVHGNWQLRNEIKDFARQMFRATFNFLDTGDVVVHSFYDAETKSNRHETLGADEFCIPYAFNSTMPDYSDIPRLTKVILRYKHQIQAMRGAWFDVDAVMKKGGSPSFDEDPETPVADSVAETMGVEKPLDDSGAPRKLLWHEGWYDLPNQDRQRYIRAIVDYQTRHVLSLIILEEANWRDAAKYKRQLDELAKYRADQAQHAQDVVEHEGHLAEVGQATAAGAVGPEQAMSALTTLQQAAPQPPLPPSWMQDPADPEEVPPQPDKKPLFLFVHGVCIEPAAGALGLGYGSMQADFNRAANTSMSQFTDAATLANCKTLLTSGAVEWEGGVFKIAPGAINRLKGTSASEMKDGGITPFSFGDANPALIQIVEKLSEWAQSSIQGPDVLSGESGKSGETARGISARIEQATKQLSVVAGKFAKEVLTPVLKNNAYLNSRFLPEEDLFQMEANLVPQGMVPPFKIGRDMYERNYQVEVRADLRFATQAQKVGEADDAMGLIMKNPMTAMNPALVYQAMKKCLEARGMRELIPLLGQAPPTPTVFGPPPPPPVPPPGMGPPGAGAPPSGMVPPGGHPNGPPPGMPPRPAPPMPGMVQ